jgi:plasmid maintenance system antidote protein VapI
MIKVRKLVIAGSSIPGAIKECLGMSVAEFALKHSRPRVSIGQVILGRRAPSEADIAALIAELGGSPDEWRELLHEAGRPVAKAS